LVIVIWALIPLLMHTNKMHQTNKSLVFIGII